MSKTEHVPWWEEPGMILHETRDYRGYVDLVAKQIVSDGRWFVYHMGMLVGEVYQGSQNWFHAWAQLRNTEGFATRDEAIDDLIYAWVMWNFPDVDWSDSDGTD